MNSFMYFYRKHFPFKFAEFLKFIKKEHILSVEITPAEGIGIGIVPLFSDCVYTLEFVAKTKDGKEIKFTEQVSEFTKTVPAFISDTAGEKRVKLIIRAQECKKQLLELSPDTSILILDGKRNEITDRIIADEMEKIHKEKVVA